MTFGFTSMKNIVFATFAAFVMIACQSSDTEVSRDVTGTVKILNPGLKASAETEPTLADGANAAAIVLNSGDLADSLILGAASEGGIEIYSLDGRRIGMDESRPVTLLDVMYNFPLGGGEVTLVVAYDAGTTEIVAYTLSEDGKALDQVMPNPVATLTEVEGLCLYTSPLTGKFYAFAAGGGYVQQWELYDQEESVTARMIRKLPVGLGAAHCVADSRNGNLYYSQETVGIWQISAEPETDAEPVAVDHAGPNGRFSGDVKGLALVQNANGKGYLLASDADASLVQVYEVPGFEHAATFAVIAGELDAVEESEGMAASSLAFTADYPGGLLVLADDDNEGEHTNFKLVSWADVVTAHGLGSGDAYDPRKPLASTTITVSATVETEPVKSYGDAADDPAIWVHPEHPELSLIIGSQKQRGINVYDLNGSLIQSLPDGRINNVDVRYNFQLGDQVVDIVTGSNRTTDSISIYAVDRESRTLYDIADGIIPTGMADPYGLCMYRSFSSGTHYVIVNDTDGVVKQWSLKDAGNGKIGADLVRTFEVGSQTEGCVADDEKGVLFVGEENVGIWKYNAEPDAGDERTSVDNTTDGNLTDDVEGLAIFYGPNGDGYLVASNQGADSYAVYERSGDNRFLGLFHVVADKQTGIDGVSETDGLDVTSAYLGPEFPHGLFVAQDGRNITPAERQNFKLVPWERIAEALNLENYSGYDPRVE